MLKHLLSCLILAAASLGAAAADHSAVREALRDSILSSISGAEISGNRVKITDFGAKGDGMKDCRKAFEKAMRHADKKGGARISVPPGTYYIKGPVTLTSNVCIDLEEGATLKFDPDPELYPIVSTSWEGTFLYNYSPMIYGYGLKNVAITGKGTIDGNAMSTFATWKKSQKAGQKRSRDMNHNATPVSERIFGDGYYLRPQLIQLYECSGVTIEGVKIINSPFWCVHLLKSENIICRSIRYDAKLINNDGIDPECSRNILIEDIYFDNGDDNIAIKSGRDNDGWTLGSPTENVIIRNCHFKGLHAVVIGSEMSAGVRNIIIEDCDYSGYCKRGIYVKTNPDRGGFVENIHVSNCRFGEVEDLFYVTSRYAGEGLDNDRYSTIRGIYVDGLTCDKATAAALVVQGTPQKPVSDIYFNNVSAGDAKIGISFSNTTGVVMNDCHIGGIAGTPTQAAEKDKIFDR